MGLFDLLFGEIFDGATRLIHRELGTWGCLGAGVLLVAALIGFFALLLR
jgi:hypothetical protein